MPIHAHPPGGLLFDIDGTLAHTDPFHHTAFNRMLAPYGLSLTLPEYLGRVMGRTNAAIMADFFPEEDEVEHIRRANLKEALFREIVAAHITPMPGLIALLDWAEANGIPKAVVTNAPRANAELVLGALGLGKRFGALVIGDELEHGKPHPLPYLTGAARLDLDPRACVAFEDSRSGVQSARSAGAYVFGIASSLAPEDLIAAGAQEALPHFEGASLRAAILAATGRIGQG